MNHLFAYGTLMCHDIMIDVSGYHLSHMSGTLRGYGRRRVKGQNYPGLVADSESSVDGVVYLDLPNAAWKRLDRFEGQMYARQLVHIELNNKATLLAETYVVKPLFLASLKASEWDFDQFLHSDKTDFQKFYKGYQLL